MVRPKKTSVDFMPLYDFYQLQNALQAQKDAETRRELEIKFLERAGPTAAEFREAREEMRKRVTDETLELSDCPYADYRLRRAIGEGK